jgi:hypothetical protein
MAGALLLLVSITRSGDTRSGVLSGIIIGAAGHLVYTTSITKQSKRGYACCERNLAQKYMQLLAAVAIAFKNIRTINTELYPWQEQFTTFDPKRPLPV